MSLLINQGKQNTSNDSAFEPIEEKDVVVTIEKIELNRFLPGNIDVTFRLMTGAHKNWTRKDTVAYDATNAFSWKYRALRSCCNVPYNENEPVQIDIEALLKDKILIVDFAITEKDGKKYQKCSYKKIDKEHIDLAFPKVEEDEEFSLPVEEESAQPTVATPQQQSKYTVSAPAPVTAEKTSTPVMSDDDDEWN